MADISTYESTLKNYVDAFLGIESEISDNIPADYDGKSGVVIMIQSADVAPDVPIAPIDGNHGWAELDVMIFCSSPATGEGNASDAKNQAIRLGIFLNNRTFITEDNYKPLNRNLGIDVQNVGLVEPTMYNATAYTWAVNLKHMVEIWLRTDPEELPDATNVVTAHTLNIDYRSSDE